jgi:KaiC/GvpD/RAD55 family RecA-like ATPase
LNLEELLDLLEGVRPAGNGYNAICPAHDDGEASLGVTEGDEGLLLQCYAGCDTRNVLSALGLTFSDLFYNAVNYAEPEAIYEYTDEQGQLLFQAVRFPGKKFRQRHIDPETGDWVWNLDGVRRVIYRLPEVLAAVAEGKTVAIVEGEKDADALWGIGIPATCNPMGAGKWRPEYIEWFRGASVAIIADRDEPGRNQAESVRTNLQDVAREIFMLQAKVGKDAYDHIAAGFGANDFVPIKQRVRRGIITAREMAEQAKEDLELTEFDIPGFVLIDQIPLIFRQGRMYALGAYTGDGKTRYALQGARKVAGEGKRITYFSLEMPERDLRNALLTHKGIPLSLLEEPWRIKFDPVLHQIYLDGVEEMAGWNLDIVFDTDVNADKIAEIVRDRESDVAIVDHVHRFSLGERLQFGQQVRKLTNVAIEQNVMLLLLCQLRKVMRGKDMEAFPRPTIQDFRETSQIADDSSMALALWRQRDASGFTYTGATQAIVLKNRHTTGPGDAAGQTFFPTFDLVRQMFVTPERSTDGSDTRHGDVFAVGDQQETDESEGGGGWG